MSSRSALLKVVWEQNRTCLVLIALLLLICSGLYLFEDHFTDTELERLRLAQTNLHQQLRQKQRQSSAGTPLSNAQRQSEELSEFKALIPSKVKFADFIGDLFAWADKVKLEIRQVNYQPKVTSETGFLEYGLSFSVQGDYAQLKRFIHLLENSSRILIVNSITLTDRPGRDSEQNEVVLNIKLTTYFQEERP